MVTKEEYAKIASSKNKKSTLLIDMLKAFVFGGLICTVGQLIFEALLQVCDKDAAAAYLSVIMVFLGSFFTGLGVYDKLAKHAGAGTIVPITGFANSIVAAAMEFKSEGLIMGMSAKMFVIAGPVLVFGTIGSVVTGIIFFIISLF